MSGAATPREESGRLTGARGEFVGSLPRRLEMLRSSLAALEQLPADPERQNGLLRRLHALGSSSRVLGFASVAEALGEAEKVLRGALMTGRPLPLGDVARTLDILPSLASDQQPEREAGKRAWPISVLVFGAPALAEAIAQGRDVNVECERTEDPVRARELARIIGPDVAVVDADRRGARELVEVFAQDQLIEPVPVLVVGSFENAEAAAPYLELGAARALPRPISPDGLWRAVDELRDRSGAPASPREPLGQLTVSSLVDRIADELKRGLVDAVEGGAQATPVALGEGADVMAAVWGAVARVRELVTLRSQGAVRFHAVGPGGAVPVAPWGAEERRAGERARRAARDLEGVSLHGRRIVVADDDPAVVWFMSGLLKAVGAEVMEAHDGRRALDLTQEHWPDAVISDVLMPELDGFSLCHEIKRDVVVRDTPVILLSWKEDLLQRLRELGADADGYLRKEAAASAVVERVREVLRARSRVEQRIDAGGEVRGRLDGLTVRLLLQLVCRGQRDARIAVRDAVYLWEIAVRQGRLLSVTRSSPAGDFARGPGVLPGLLGATAGRFAIEPDSTPCRSEFEGELVELLREPVARARAALRAVSADALVRVSGMTFDRPSVEPYLACTPQPALGLTRRLLDGVSPRDLVLEGQADPRLLEAVLSDLARRGAIYSVEREPGASLFPPKAPPPVVRPPEDADLDWDEELAEADIAPAAATAGPAPVDVTPPPELVLTASPAPPRLEPAPSEPQQLRVSGAGEMPFDQQMTPSSDWMSGPLFAFGPEHGTLPGVGGVPKVEARAPETPPEPEPQPEAEPLAEADVAPPASAHSLLPLGELVASPPAPESVPVPAPVTEEPPPPSHSLLPLDELARAAAEAPPASPASSPAPAGSAPPVEKVHSLLPLDELRAPASSAEPAPLSEEEAELAAVLTMGDTPPPPMVAPVRSGPPPLPPEPFVVEDADLGLGSQQRSPLSEPPAVPSAPLTTEALLAAVTPAVPEAEAKSGAPAKVESLHKTAVMYAVAPAVARDAEPERGQEGQSTAKMNSLVEPHVVKGKPHTESLHKTAVMNFVVAPPAEPEEGPLADEDEAAEDDEAEEVPVRRSAAPPPSEARQRKHVVPPPQSSRDAATVRPAAQKESKGYVQLILVAAATAGGFFALLHFVVFPLLLAPEEAAPPAVASAPLPAPKPAAPATQPKIETLPLPTGIEVQSGLGLLEVEVSEPLALYVDGEFIGKGPLRRAPLQPGRHELTIGEGGDGAAVSVDVTVGARTRVTLPAAPR